ncbi:hypothetical protein [Oceanobacillus alkalisoli]|uniref:hypothetical protein n=1 Tax=Oceanobacillus alkalisoli TaxID=2925113 RepID=UPI001EEFFD9C|nr:hypothetical protein [Oceanobacillus alkalisoli]MCF3943348.1 hypothetical protein [Oceanobacillus alkalisoli]MCG5105289.1 hypothetical protein [Oceanobacillus alkalisoli]
MVIPRKSLLNQKIEQLKNGENAFAESAELIRLLERDIARENLNVVFDKTPAGCWIIPQKDYPEMSE